MTKEEEEWTVVTSQDKRRVIRSGRRSRSCCTNRSTVTAAAPKRATLDWTSNHFERTKSAVLATMDDCQRHVVHTDFFQSLRSSLGNRLEEQEVIQQIVCFGIGNLSSASSPSYNNASPSMWQLACALAIREYLCCRKKDNTTTKLSFFDPCTTIAEAQVMEDEWFIDVLSDNTRGRYPVVVDKGVKTLFFMPHCPMYLYSNVLWANWYNLDRIILFGNSIPLYHERAIEKNKVPDTMTLLLPFIKETQVHVSKADIESTVMMGDLERAFNDCYVTVFAIDNGAALPPRPDMPLVQDDDELK